MKGAERSIEGRYLPHRLLKSGAGTETFLGTDLTSGRSVVIKLASDAHKAWLEHEARAVGHALATGREGDTCYLVLPFVDGISLAERLERGRLGVDEALAVGRGVLSQLAEAHARGVLHRDVKPSNVIVARTGPLAAATLIDFGLARSEQLDSRLRDVAVGTLQYMSPELAGSLGQPVGPPSDLYAVGVLLHECLTGQPPFRADTASELLRLHLTARPPALLALCPEAPRALEQVLLRLLGKDPRDRYQSAAAAEADLAAIAEARRRGIEPDFPVGALDRRAALTAPEFVGRAAELARLREAALKAARGEGGLVLLEGESGAGKSRLLDELAVVVCDGRGGPEARPCEPRPPMRVRHGHGIDQGAARPFQILSGVVAQLVEELQHAPAAARALRERLGEHADAVADAVPELAPILYPGPRATLGPESLAEARSLRGFGALLDALGTPEQPALVLLDDCQWADSLSTELIVRWSQAQAASAPAARHVTVVAAFRSEEVAADHPLRRRARGERIELDAFDPLTVRQMAESMAGPLPGEILAVLEHLAEGNPFMVSAVLPGLVETGALRPSPTGWTVDAAQLRQAQSSRKAAVFLAQRLRTFPRELLEVLQVAAVLGKQFELSFAARLLDREPAEVRVALAEARRRHVVWELPGSPPCFAFVHDKLRETLLELLLPDERTQLHRRAAQALLAEDPGRVFDLAYHFDAAGDHERAFAPALAAAGQARSRRALEVAERYLRMAERAQQADPRGRFQVAEQLAEVLMLRGRYDDAAIALENAARLAETRHERVRIEAQRGELAFKRGDVDGARGALERGIRLLGRFLPRSMPGFVFFALWEAFVQVLHTLFPRLFLARRPLPAAGADADVEEELLAIRLYSRLAYAYWFGSGRFPCLWTHLRELNLIERYPPTPELAQAYSEHAPVMTMLPKLERGIRYAARSLEIRRSLGDLWGQGQSYHFQGVVLYAASRYRDSIESCEEAMRLLERTGDRWEVNTAAWHIAFCHYRLGELGAAVEAARRAHRSGLEIGDHQASGISLSGWAKASGGRLPLPVIEAELERSRPDDVHTRAEVLQGLAVCLLQKGEPGRAVEALETAQRLVEAQGLQQEYVSPILPWLVTALRAQRDALSPFDVAGRRRLLEHATRISRRALAVARRYRNNLPHALREAGLVAALRGRFPRARRALEASLAEARAQGAALEEAQTREALGLVGQAAGWPDAARELAEGRAQRARLEAELDERPGPELGVREPTVSLLDRFETLLEVARPLAAALSRDSVFQLLRDAGLRLLRAEDCTVVPLGADGQPPREEAVLVRGLIARAVAAGRPIAVGELDPVAPTDSVILAGLRSAMCAPIVVHGQPEACLVLAHKQVGSLFGDDELRLCELISTLAGVALENAAGFQRSQEAVRVRDDFLSIAGHELRTPLAALKMQLQLLEKLLAAGRRDASPERVSRALNATTRLERLVTDLLDVARIAQGRLSLEPEPCELSELVHEVLDRFGEALSGAGCALTYRADGPSRGRWDRARLDQVLSNVISNAIKYGAGKPIEVVVGGSEDRASISVRDHGIGIAEADRWRIFERFERAVPDRYYGGLGLGLWIANQIVLAHEGHIRVDSKPGEGAVFHIELPRCVA